MRAAVLTLLLGLAACGDDGARAGTLQPVPLPTGVRFAPTDPHSPRTLLREEGEQIVLEVELPGLDHPMRAVTVHGPDPGFAPLGEMQKGSAPGQWLWRRPRAELPAVRHLVLISDCPAHGRFGAAQALVL
jgi:hypothetical protein